MTKLINLYGAKYLKRSADKPSREVRRTSLIPDKEVWDKKLKEINDVLEDLKFQLELGLIIEIKIKKNQQI